MGRSGTEIPPEVVLACLVTLATIFLSSFFVSIPTFGKTCKLEVYILPPVVCCVAFFLFVCLSVPAAFHLLGTEH